MTTIRDWYPGHAGLRRAVLVVAPVSLLALQAPAWGMSLADTVQQSLERRPMVNTYKAQREVAKGYQRQSEQWLGGEPQAALRYQSDQMLSDDGLRETEGYVELPLWLPGQRQAREALASRLLAEADRGPEQLRWKVSEQVRERAWTLRLAQAARVLAEHQLESTKAFEDEIRRRVTAGELARTDLILAQQETSRRESVHQEAIATEQQARAAWVSYTGFEQLPDNLEEDFRASGEIGDSHPLLAAAAATVQRQRAARDDARISQRANPLLYLGARRERGSSDDPHINSLGAEIKIPFGGAGHAAPAIAEAEAALTEAEAKYLETRNELELALEQQRLALEQAKTGVALARNRNQLAQEALRLSERAFELGESNLRALLLARQDGAAAALNLELRSLERLRDIARYNQALGVIPQ
jgi:outer membrane protein TolC